MTLLVVAIFAAWALAAALAQHPSWSQRLSARSFGLLPNFLFFTARIAGHEMALLVREEQGGGSWGPWHEVRTTRARNPAWFLWHPERRYGKAILDLALRLIHLRMTGRRSEAPADPAYAALAHWASAEVPPGARFQFGLRASDMLQEGAGQMLFVSEPCGP